MIFDVIARWTFSQSKEEKIKASEAVKGIMMIFANKLASMTLNFEGITGYKLVNIISAKEIFSIISQETLETTRDSQDSLIVGSTDGAAAPDLDGSFYFVPNEGSE